MSLLSIEVTGPIDALVSESTRLHRNDPSEAHAIAMRAREMSVAAGYSLGEAMSLFRSATALRLLGRKGEALEQIESAQAVFSKIGDTVGLLRCKNHRASLLRDGGSEVDAIVLFSEVVAEAEACGEHLIRFSALSGIASAYEVLGDKPGMLEAAKEALETARAIGNDGAIGVALCNLANAHLEFEGWHEAIALFREALPLLDAAHDADSEANALANIGYACWRAGELPEARKAYEHALEFSRAHSNLRMTITSEACLGHLYAEGGQQGRPSEREAAIRLTTSALDSAAQSGFSQEHLQVLQKAAETYLALGETAIAKTYFEQALERAQGFNAARTEILEKLAPLYAMLGDTERAYNATLDRIQLVIEMAQRDRVHSMQAFEVRRQLARNYAERLQLVNEKRQLEDLARSRSRELTQLALNLADRFELLQTIREQLLAAEGDKRAIVRAIDRHLEATDGWRTFEMQFQSIYAEFSSALLQAAPELTPSEIRVCSLLKLGLSSKQIADILRASPRTVEWHRTAIRKKLGLASNDNLSTYLTGLGAAEPIPVLST